MKYRALRLDSGNYSWGSENCTKKVRILDVVNNAIMQIDGQPFRQWYLKKYGVNLGLKKGGKKEDSKEEAVEKRSNHVICKQKFRASKQKLDPTLEDQFQSGRLLACIASRPGQSGRADGYILEGEELAFYKRKLEKKKKA